MSDITARQLIKTVEDALAIVALRSDKLGITLTKAELELSATATDEGGGTVKFDWIVTVEAGGKVESSSKHVLSLTLVPKIAFCLSEARASRRTNSRMPLSNSRPRLRTRVSRNSSSPMERSRLNS